MVDEQNTEQVTTDVEEEEVLEAAETKTEVTNQTAETEDFGLDGQETDEEANEESVPTDTESEDSENEEDEDSDEQFVPLSKLRKVRNEAKNLRERLKASEAQVEELESKLSTQSDSELQAKINEYKTELEKERLSNSLAAVAGEHGAIDPDVLITLIPMDKVEWEDSKPSNLDDVINELKERFPRQFRKTTGSGNVGSRDESNRKSVGDMSLDETQQAAIAAMKRQKK